MPTLTVQDIEVTGTLVALVTPDVGGDEFKITGREIFMIDNASGGPVDVTFTAQAGAEVFVPGIGDLDGSQDIVVTVAAGTVQLVGLFLNGKFQNASGRVEVLSDTTVSVTYGPLKVKTS